MPSILLAILALAGLTIASPFAILSERTACNSSSLNETIGTYTVLASDTIFTIAKTVNRGACDIARYNRLPDATEIYTGELLYIPPQVCSPDSSSCLLTPTNATMDCVIGGSVVYTTWSNETITSIALEKFNITVESLNATVMGVDTVDTPIEEGKVIKVPDCSPSQCIFQPYRFAYGTYKDLAEEYGTTPGQIQAMNPQYNHSEAAQGAGSGALIILPMNCTLLSSNYTEVN